MSTNIQFNGSFRINSLDQSALFFGDVNTANGWGSHGKVNSITQLKGRRNKLENNQSFLFDQDYIDTVIDDRDIHLLIDQTQISESSSIDLETMNINSMDHNSNILVGKSTVTGIDGHVKSNLGSGFFRGDYNQSVNNFSMNVDTDVIDTLINDQDVKVNFGSNT